MLKAINEKGFEGIETNDKKILSEKKEEGLIQNREFTTERDSLEDQYHKIIKVKIQRKRKKQAKKRQMLGKWLSKSWRKKTEPKMMIQ